MLPEIHSLAEYRHLYRRTETWLPALCMICERHGLDPASLRPASPGSHIVYLLGSDKLVKLFCPLWHSDAQTEALVLGALNCQAEFHVPRILASGELEGWQYLVLSRLQGTPLDELWYSLSQTEKLEIATSLGSLMQVLHRTPTAVLEALQMDWEAFLNEQHTSFAERQRAAGASPGWVSQCTRFLDNLPRLSQPPTAPVLLHADLNPEHLFCEQTPSGWRITGIIDFGDAMLGHQTYEFIAPGFLFKHQPALRRRMMVAYGYAEAGLDEALSRTLLAVTLLHRFASLPEFLALCGEPAPSSLADIQRILWDFQLT